jgi:sporulation-control protein spo0M
MLAKLTQCFELGLRLDGVSCEQTTFFGFVELEGDDEGILDANHRS